jgi:hypothetical protein
MDLRPRHDIFPLRIASVLLINNQHAPRLRISPIHLHLTFIPTSHLYTYIYCLDRLPTTLPLLPRSTASSAYLPRCLYCLDRLPTPLPLLPRSTASSAYLPRCLHCLKRIPTTAKFEPRAHTSYCQIRASSAYPPHCQHCQIRFRPARNHSTVRY